MSDSLVTGLNCLYCSALIWEKKSVPRKNRDGWSTRERKKRKDTYVKWREKRRCLTILTDGETNK